MYILSLTVDLRVVALLVASCGQLPATSALAADQLPCADDCIAAFELLWIDGESDEIMQSAINDITDQLVRQGHERISGIAIQERRYVFVAFSKRCDEKETELGVLLEATFSFLLPGVEFRVMRGPFTRGPDTIDFDGEYWDESQCYEDCPKKGPRN